LGGLAYLGIVAVVIAAALENRRAKCSDGRAPRGQAPGAGGQAPRRLPSADPGGDLGQGVALFTGLARPVIRSLVKTTAFPYGMLELCYVPASHGA
jgi:hypothetical protein